MQNKVKTTGEQGGLPILCFCDGLAVCADDHELYARARNRFDEPGDMILMDELYPVSLLTQEQRERVQKAYTELTPDELEARQMMLFELTETGAK